MQTRQIPLGCSTLGFRLDPLDVALTEIAAQGIHLVDLAMYPGYSPHFNPVTASPDEQCALADDLERRGLTVATLNAGDGLLGVPASRERTVEYARASLRLAKDLGAYGVTMQSGVEPPPNEWLTVARGVADDLRILGEEAAALGLELTLELHKSMLMASQQEAVDLMDLVDHPAVGVAIDPSHATYAGENVAAIARTLGPLVKHVHLRDARGKDIWSSPATARSISPTWRRPWPRSATIARRSSSWNTATPARRRCGPTWRGPRGVLADHFAIA